MLKAKRATVLFGEIELEVFMLPDGSYEFSMTQVALSIEKHPKSVRQFLEGKSVEAIPFKDFGDGKIEIEGETAARSFTPVPTKLMLAYWSYWAKRGNEKAQALLMSGTEETLNRKCDVAFGISKTEEEYNNELAANIPTNILIAKLLKAMERNNELQEELREQKSSRVVLENEKLKLELASQNIPGARAVLDNDSEECEDCSYVTVEQFLLSVGFQLEKGRLLAVKRRAASFYRAAKHAEPTKSRGRNVYRANEIEFIRQALKAELNF